MTDFASILLHLCRRPGMYTPTGSYREVVAYVAGFDRGRPRLSTEYVLNEWGCEIDRFGEWLATRIGADGRVGWWVVLLGQCGGDEQWACNHCIRAGRALEGHPAVQTWCDHNPYFAFIDKEFQCEDCGQRFVFAASEQQHWYETLKFWVQSQPKQCIQCRRARRERRRAAREEQARRQ